MSVTNTADAADTGTRGRAADTSAIAAFLIDVHPDGSFELRAIRPERGGGVGSQVFAGGEHATASRWAAGRNASGANVYVTLNPVRSDLTGSASDADILVRRWVLIDCDPARADPNANATDDEKASARALADAVLAYLASMGWPAPTLADSGNGFHLLYRVELPADDARAYFESRLRAMNAQASRVNPSCM